jgi:hypothetical protein
MSALPDRVTSGHVEAHRRRSSGAVANFVAPPMSSMLTATKLALPALFLSSRQVVADALDLVEVAGH